jgi:predicted DNA-binding transcriptional regulator
MATLEKLRDVVKIRREVEEMIREIEEFLKNNDTRQSTETVCYNDKVRLVCIPRGCIAHILSNDEAVYTILVSDDSVIEVNIIDWKNKIISRNVGDEEIAKVLREMNAENHMDRCLGMYMERKGELLSKLKAVIAMLRIL